MKIRCLIVDDEELAVKVIEKYISTIPTLELTGTCDNAVEAISFLHSHEVDLLFLDINMPEMSGLEMLRTLSHTPHVILTTAYSEFALESYEFGVVDYLLKPIKLDRFIKAVNKVVDLYESSSSPDQEKISASFIFIKEEHVTHKVDHLDILYVEAYGNYLKIHTSKKVYVTRETMQHFQEKLPRSIFVRCHKSFIVNLSHVTKAMGNVLYINSTEVPIGSLYKAEVMRQIQDK